MRADATCYRHPDRRAAVACQRCDRPICTDCMIQASVGFHCPEDAKGGKQQVYTSRTLFGAGGRPVVTLSLIAVNLAVFVVGLGMGENALSGGSDRLTIDGGLLGGGYLSTGEFIGVDSGEWYRIVTGGFLHSGILHVGFNMYLLYLMGQILEPALGRVPFTVAYFFSLLAGAFGVLLLDPAQLTVGASGAVFGLMGVLVVFQRSRGQSIFDSGLGGLLILNLVLTFAVSNISIGGHLGGLIGGLIAGWLLIELPRRSRALPAYLPTLTLVALGAAVFGASLWAAAQWADPVF